MVPRNVKKLEGEKVTDRNKTIRKYIVTFPVISTKYGSRSVDSAMNQWDKRRINLEYQEHIKAS